jgi:exopolysaccharide production protein ExoZ
VILAACQRSAFAALRATILVMGIARLGGGVVIVFSMELPRNQGIQAARAIAALAVAYFHSYVAVRGFPETAATPIYALSQWGFLGVDLFFAVSGYVICLVASRPGFSRSSFLIKRAFRLYPMYLTAMVIVGLLALSGHYNFGSIGHYLYSLTLLPQNGPPAFDLSWTLEREVVFYLIAMLIIPLTGIPALAALLGVLAVAGWYFGDPWTFHIVSIRQASFLAGVMVFLMWPRTKSLGAMVPILTGLAVLWPAIWFNADPLRPVAMTCILAGMVNLRLRWNRWPARWLIAAGDASYSIYLLHYFVFYFASAAAITIFGWFPVLKQNWLCEPWRWAAILICCVISHLTWRMIESPMNALGNALASNHAHDVVADDRRLHSDVRVVASVVRRDADRVGT